MGRMKPFDLALAKANNPVQTKDGRSARIICYNAKNLYTPIVALVMCGTHELPYTYTNDGKYNPGKTSDFDLVMAPIKREGWINICSSEMHLDKTIGFTSDIYRTEELAIKGKTEYDIATIKIEWEE